MAVVDMDRARGERVDGEIAASGGEAAAFVADVSSEEDVRRMRMSSSASRQRA